MRLAFVSTLFLLAAAKLHAAGIGLTANGTCFAGSCPPAALAVGSNDKESFNYTLTLANGDTYLIDGDFTATNSSGFVAGAANHAFQVTYEGNAAGGPSAADSITVQAYYALQTTLSSELIFRAVIGAFGGGIKSGSTASSCELGGVNGCVGTLAPPGAFSVDSSDFTITPTAGVFNFDPYFTNNFAAGSPVGSYIVWGQTTPITPAATVPEPASFALLIFGLGAIWGRRLLRF